MKFYEWVVEEYLNTRGPFGDLAADLYIDTYDGPNTREGILEHLYEERAYDACIQTFKECWQSYEDNNGKDIPTKIKPIKKAKPILNIWQDSAPNKSLFHMNPEIRECLFEWIGNNLYPNNSNNPKERSSNGLKHVFENRTGHYVTNSQFKDAMIVCGYKAHDKSELNHVYSLDTRSPMFK